MLVSVSRVFTVDEFSLIVVNVHVLQLQQWYCLATLTETSPFSGRNSASSMNEQSHHANAR